MANFSLILVFKIITFWLLCSCSYFCATLSTLSQSQPHTNNTSLVSKGEIFTLGFFQPGNSKKWYLGIWYNKIPIKTVVWVANRVNPINDSSGLLVMNNVTGNFDVLSQNNKTVVWSTSSARKALSPVLELLDSGNLVLRDEKDEGRDNYLWQSFDYPSDTLLPGMKLGWDKRKKLNRRLSAWKSPDDPSPGNLTWEMELHEYPEPVMWNGTKEFLRSGPWNGIQYSGKPTKALPSLKYSFFSSEDEIYLTLKMVNESILGRMVLNETNFHRQSWIWSETEKNWTMYAAFPRDRCDEYSLCGGNAFCSLSMTPNCQCLDKFTPNSMEKWNSGQYSGGCERKKALRNCRSDDGFLKIVGLKLPDTSKTWVNVSLGLKECRIRCLSNCSCMAYSNTDVRDGGKGCAHWHGDLLDMKQIPGGGQDFFIRVLKSEIGDHGEKWKIGLIIAFSIFISLGLILLYYFTSNKRGKLQVLARNNEDQEDLELPLFDLSTISSATEGFSLAHKLGEGGFGPVYRGRLGDGREIAVKRLSRSSGQGLKEFKNEVILIAKLQHRNLVRLLGCCIEGDEKLLVYEFMPNKSLDYFIFDETRGKLLDWPTRFNIISGIARGLLYLHQDSRLRIIHRDLKASNVLLDREMNPKISDFGLARTFGGDETEGNTNRIVGTYGYMAPEYATEGQFSVKSDVFSFGILLLEIVSGKRSKGFYNMKHNGSLIANAWTMWREGRPLEVMDEKIANNSCHVSQVMRCVHVSLLCVQQRPEERPTMSAVVQMLGSETSLPEPTQPGFVAVEKQSVPPGEFFAPITHELVSVNEVTITLLHAR